MNSTDTDPVDERTVRARENVERDDAGTRRARGRRRTESWRRRLPWRAAAELLVFLGTNVYWYLRYRTTRRALTTSRDWDAGTFETDVGDSPGTAERALLKETTDVADVPLEEVPEQFERLHDRIAAQEKRNDELCSIAASAWWGGLETRTTRAECGPRAPIYLADLPEAGHEIARQVAIQAVEDERGVVVAVGREDGSVSVGVGGELSGTISAIDVARDVLTPLGGSAGGSEELANGGGSDPESILASAREVVDGLQEERGAGDTEF